MKIKSLLSGISGIMILVLSAGISSTQCVAMEQKNLEVVKLDSGLISGLLQGGTWTYLGIPYAKPPVGDLRWKLPEAPKAWSGIRRCTKYGPSCPQPQTEASVGRMAEDCLYLNVWTPAKEPSDKLPVMVWIHGGAYVTGSGSEPTYNGLNLSKQGVIVVTINYRLGPFGFMAHPLLSKESPKGTSGNYGLLDQVEALNWVQRNIQAFGGDPGRVTIFGESAGGQSVNILLVSPLSKGLFQRAISESGPQWHFGLLVPFTPLKEAEKKGEQFAAELGCDKAKDPVAAMRAKKPDELIQTWGWTATEMVIPDGIQFQAVVDGWFLPDRPEVLFKAGKQHDVPVLIGSNKNEGAPFAGLAQSKGTTVAEYKARVLGTIGELAPEVLTMFPADTDEQAYIAIANLLTQMDFASFPRFICESVAKTKSKAYLYQFTRVPPTKYGALLGCYHSCEMPYVFGNFVMSDGYKQEDLDLSMVMMGYWTGFASSGDPNGGGRPAWPYYGPKDQNLELGDQVRVNAGLFKAQCDLAEKIYAGGKP